MPRSSSQVTKLKTLIRLAQALLSKAEAGTAGSAAKVGARRTNGKSATKPSRRSGKELVAFRKMLKPERKKGVPVAELARRHGIPTVYVYKLK